MERHLFSRECGLSGPQEKIYSPLNILPMLYVRWLATLIAPKKHSISTSKQKVMLWAFQMSKNSSYSTNGEGKREQGW